MTSFRRLIVFPLLTLKDLKDKVHIEFKIDGSRQQWIFFDQIATDETKTLFDYKVTEPDTDVYLYIQDQQPAIPDRGFKPKLAPVPEVYKSPYAEVRKVHRLEPIKKTPAVTHKTAPIAEVSEINDISVSLAKSLELEKEYKKFEAQVAVTGRLDLPQPAGVKPIKTEPTQVKTQSSSAPLSPPNRIKPVITQSEENILNISDSDNEETKKKLELKNGDKTPKVGVVLPQNATPPTWTCRICTLINPEPNDTCEACDFKRLPKPTPSSPTTKQLPLLNGNPVSSNSNNQTPVKSMNGNVAQINNPTPSTKKLLNSTAVPSEIVQSLVAEKFTVRNTAIPGQNLPSQQLNDCEENLPTPTNIVMTAFVSPNISKVKYRGVDNYNPRAAYVFPTVAEALNSKAPIIKSVMLKNPDKFEPDLVKPENNNNRLSVCSTSSTGVVHYPSTSGNTYLELCHLETTGYITNLEPFECCICFLEYGKGEGAVLRECLHTFCKECLANTVEHCDEPEVKCPYIDKDYSCDCILQVSLLKPNLNFLLNLR